MATKSTNIEYELISVAKLILKEEGINEGYWTIQVQFMMGAGNVGQDQSKPDDIYPTGFVSLKTFGLKRVDQPGPLVIDASKLNTD